MFKCLDRFRKFENFCGFIVFLFGHLICTFIKNRNQMTFIKLHEAIIVVVIVCRFKPMHQKWDEIMHTYTLE